MNLQEEHAYQSFQSDMAWDCKRDEHFEIHTDYEDDCHWCEQAFIREQEGKAKDLS